MESSPEYKEWNIHKFVKSCVWLFILFSFPTILFSQTLGFSEISQGQVYSSTSRETKLKWIDYDHDGDLDIVYGVGWEIGFYRNDGTDFFVKQVLTTDTYSTTNEWADFDHDGDIDLLAMEDIYLNSGSGGFTRMDNPVFETRNIYGIDLGDADNDGDLDVISIYANSTHERYYGLIYFNEGGEFIRAPFELPLDRYAGCKWIDINGDNYLDVAFTDGDSLWIYKNDHLDFSLISALPWYGNNLCEMNIFDIGNDNDLDIVTSTGVLVNDYPSFSMLPRVGFPSQIEAGDADNDGDTDILYTYYNQATQLYLYETGSYVSSGLTFPITPYAFGDWGDYDGDGDLDLALSYSLGATTTLSIFKNTLNTVNSTPTVPANSQAIEKLSKVELSWDASTDSETPASGLFYNFYIHQGATIIKPSHSDILTGYLPRNSNDNSSQLMVHEINRLSPGTYTWGVQSIDGANKSSAFTSPATFTITHSNDIAPVDNQILLSGESGTQLTVTETGSFDTRDWAYSASRGGPYTSLGSSSSTYTPVFSAPGDYYVVCLSKLGSDTAVSNEVQIVIPFFSQTELSVFPNTWLGSLVPADFDNDGDYDIFCAAFGDPTTNILYENNAGTYEVSSGFDPPDLVSARAICFDYNNDELIDIFFCGEVSVSENSAAIYKNTGGLNFIKAFPFDDAELEMASIDHGDYDNDGFQDLIICGLNVEDEPVSKVYRNMGNGLFEDIGAPILPASGGMVKFNDLNNDGYLDVFICGSDLSGNIASEIYANDGDGSFVRVESTIPKLRESQIDIGDYNNDGYHDILMNGSISNGTYYSYLLKNTGDFLFTVLEISSDESSYNSDIWIDYDNDNDLDILRTCNNTFKDYNSTYPRNLLLENTGNDIFIKNHVFKNQMSYESSSSFAKFLYNSDNNIDFIQECSDPVWSGNKVILFENQTQVAKNTPAVPTELAYSSQGDDIELSWKDNSISDNVVTFNVALYTATSELTGSMADKSNGFRKIAEFGDIQETTWVIGGLDPGAYYWRVQAIDNSLNSSVFSVEDTIIVEELFTYTAGHPFEDLRYPATDWGDYDDDGDMDLVIAGKNASGDYMTRLYKNTNAVFSEVTTNFTEGYGSHLSSVEAEWTDIDNDNDLDLIVRGMLQTSSESRLEFYRNNGGDSFTLEFSITGTNVRAYASGDIDNDGDLDFAVNLNRILINNGDFNFTEVNISLLGGSFIGYLNFVDIDNDLDLDISSSSFSNSRFLFNQGGLNFNIVEDPLVPINSFGETSFFDYNNDTYADYIFTGRVDGNFLTQIYENKQDGTFSLLNAMFKGSNYGTISIGDYENDGDSDFFICGENTIGFAELYINNGDGTFVDLDYPFPSETYRGEARMGDMNNDGDLDIFVPGYNITNLYENSRDWQNTPPDPPGSLSYSREGLGVILNWDDGSDLESVNGGLSYNVRIGTSPGGCEIVAPSSDLLTGYRKLTKIGNAQYNMGYKLDTLPVGTYYWSVQAIDHGFAGGPWSAEQTIILSSINVDFSADEVCEGSITSFTDNSVPVGVTITHWDWNFGDGVFSTVQNPVHQFSNFGTFNVKLVVSYMNEGTKTPGDSITNTVTVLPKIETGFSASTACEGIATDFYNGSVFNGLTASAWLWEFGDGLNSSAEEPGNHGYLNAGDYNVRLSVTASNGCVDTIIQLVQVSEYPETAVTADAPLNFCLGDSVNLSVVYNTELIYKWKRDGTLVSAGDSSMYTAKISGPYTVEVENPIGNCAKTSDVKVISAQTAPSAPTISNTGSTGFCDGDSTVLSVTDIPDTNYRWLRNGGTVGSNQSSYVAKADGNYTLEVSNLTGCTTSSSNVVSVIVNQAPSIPTVIVSGATTLCDGLSVNLSVTNDGAMDYQWYNGAVTIGGATTNSFDADETGEYKLSIENSAGCVSVTVPTSVTVNPTPSSPTITESGPTTFCDVDSVVLSVTDDPTVSYQWQLNGGAVGTDVNEHIVKTGGNYALEIRNASLCTSTSNTVVVTIHTSPVIPTIGVNGEILFCEGQSVELSVTNDPSLTYQWKDGELNLGGATTNSYTAETTGNYKLNVSSGDGCEVETQVVQVIADPAPTSPTIAYIGELEFCDKDSLVLSVTENPNYSYEWLLNGGTVSTVSNSYTARAAGDYTVSVKNLGECYATSANTVSLIVHASPASPTLNLSGPATFCEDKNLALSVSEPGADSYQWLSGLGEMIDSTGTSIIVDETGVYKVRVRNTGQCEAFSQEIAVTVNTYPTTPVILTDNYILDACQADDPVILSVETVKMGTVYQWSRNGVPISGEGSSSLTGYLEEGDYTVEAISNSCGVESQILTIRYGEMPEKPEIHAEGPVIWYLACSNDSATAYRWYLNGEIIEGADEFMYVAGMQEGRFEVAISKEGSCYTKSDPMWIPLGTDIEVDPWENLQIYPNPTPGLFTLEMDNHLMGELIIDIFGETGSKIINIKFHKETSHFKTQIDLSEQPSAAYMIGLMLDKYRTNRTLIVE